MSARELGVAGVVPVVDNGSFVERFGIAVLSEGFTAGELDIFRTAVDDLIATLHQTEPFASNWNCLSLTRIETVNGVSGLAPGRQTAASCFGAEAGTAPRTLRLDWDSVEQLTSRYEPDWTAIVVLVNDTSERGCTYHRVAVTTLQSDWLSVVVHELGHAGFRLEDEYDYGGGSRYRGPEPGAPNVTRCIEQDGLKWARLVDLGTPIPTQLNPDCGRPDTNPSSTPAGTVGTFEGA
ncbi:MAG: M64 family metallopeptidase, partial [Solirubrobacteraceae bacterium]